jgi:hypothetical protein
MDQGMSDELSEYVMSRSGADATMILCLGKDGSSGYSMKFKKVNQMLMVPGLLRIMASEMERLILRETRGASC